MALLKFVNFKLFHDLGLSEVQELTKSDVLDTEIIKKLQKLARKKF